MATIQHAMGELPAKLGAVRIIQDYWVIEGFIKQKHSDGLTLEPFIRISPNGEETPGDGQLMVGLGSTFTIEFLEPVDLGWTA